MSPRFSHDLHFGLQLDSALGQSRLLDFFDQFQHFGRCRAAVIDNKITVHLRDSRFSDA